MNKRKRIGYPIFEAVLSFLAVLLIAIGFSDDILARGLATTNYLAKLNPNGNDFLVYSTVMRSLEDNSNISSSYLRSFRSDATYLRTLSYLDDKGDVVRVGIASNNYERQDFAVCNLETYSNTTRFENLNISLLRDIPRTEELNDYGTNGFVFIPDYIADEIIESSNGDLKNYDDLVPDYSSMNEAEITSFLDKYALSVTNVYGDSFRYKISNIFRVKGFNETYLDGRDMPEETTIGASLESFFGNYLFLFSQSLFRNDEVALFNFAQNRQFSLHYDLYNVTSINKAVKLELTCYLREGDGYVKSEYYSDLIWDSFVAHRTDDLYKFILCVGIFFLIAAAVLPFIFKAKVFVEPRTYLWNIIFLLGVALVFNILEVTIGATSFAFLTFNNFLCGGSILVLIGFSAYFYFSEKRRWRKGL